MSFLMKFLFPPSIFVTATTLVSFSILVTYGLSEIRGKSMQYSKFAGVKNSVAESKKRMISSRAGMVMLYTPAFLAGLSSFAIFPDEGFRFFLLKSAITIHYLKRILESSFVHKYSGEMALGTMIVILSSYFSSSVFMIIAQHLTMGFPEPEIDLKNPGILLFLVGIIGNFYHHIRLSKLRSGTGKGAKEYKIPKGGLFDFVICPHYLFEVLIFWGFALISQTVYSFAFALGTTCYLTGRSYATRRWYLSKFEDFPKGVKAIIPFVF